MTDFDNVRKTDSFLLRSESTATATARGGLLSFAEVSSCVNMMKIENAYLRIKCINFMSLTERGCNGLSGSKMQLKL